MVQGLDSAAYLVPVIAQNSQLSSTSGSVITLGKLDNVPLIRPRSELVDRFEPHDYIYSGVLPRGATVDGVADAGWGGGVPGVVQ